MIVVGDPQQSIYRFRGADIDAYHFVEDILSQKNKGESLVLTTNFRSCFDIAHWVNEAFSDIFPQKKTTYQTSYSKLFPVKLGQNGSGVYRINGQYKKAKERVNAQADEISQLILKERETERVYSDYLIICPRHDDLHRYACFLNERGIPVQNEGGDLGGMIWLEALETLFRLYEHPHDVELFMAVLKGAFFQIQEEDLWEVKQKKGLFPLHESENMKGVFFHLDIALASLSFLYQQSREQGIDVALILHALSPYSIKNNSEVMLFIAHLEEHYRLLKSSEYEGASFYRQKTEEFMKGYGSSSASEEGVRLMTIHGSKGLQADTVFLVGEDSKEHGVTHIFYGGYRKECVFFPKAQSSLLKKVTRSSIPPLYIYPPQFKKEEKEAQLYQEAEKERLLYVAVTRAEQRLFISDQAQKPWSRLTAYLSNQPFLDSCF